MPSIIKDGVVIATCDYTPDAGELSSRGETIVTGLGVVGQTWDGFSFSDPVVTMSTADKLEAIKAAVQAELDSIAKTYGYDSILTAVTYVGSPVVKFNGEAIAFRNWRANCWDTCYTLLAQWQAGQINEMSPTEVVAVLPLFVEP
jgi:hypothetical protein